MAPIDDAPAEAGASDQAGGGTDTLSIHPRLDVEGLIGAVPASCEVCDRLADPCRCALTPCFHPDHDDDPDGDDHPCATVKAEDRCRHLGPLRRFRRDVFAHRGCVPAGWRPERPA